MQTVCKIVALALWLIASARATTVYLPPATGALTYLAVTGATNATPIVITSAAHGLSNAAAVWCQNIGGNQNANGYFAVAGVTTNTFQLTYLYYTGNVAGSGAYTSGGTCTPLTAYTLASHPRVLLDGAAGALTASLSNTSDKANASNPFYVSLGSEVTAFSSIYTTAGIDSEGGVGSGCGGDGCGMGRYGVAGLYWLATGNATALTIAKWGIDNFEQIVYAPMTFNCTITGSPSQCNRDDTLVMLHPNEDAMVSMQNFSMIRSQLTSTEISNFADKVLNDNALLVNANSTKGNGIGGISTDFTTSCTPWPSGATPWTQADHYCGGLWMWKHECNLTMMNPGQETNYQNDYPGGAGCEFGQEWPYDSNHTMAHQRAAIAAGIALADDDPRAQMLLTQTMCFFFKWEYAHAKSSWTGMTENGSRYQQYVDNPYSPELVSMLKKSLGYDLSGGNWMERLLPQELYGLLPDGGSGTGNTPLGLDAWLDSSGTNCCTGDIREWSYPTLDLVGLFPSDAYASSAMYLLNNSSSFSGESWQALQNNLFMQYIYYDPAASSSNPNGNLTTQFLFRDTDYSTCQSVFGATSASHNYSTGNPGTDTSGCYPNWGYQFAISKSSWSFPSSATQVLMAASFGSSYEDRSGCGQYGAYHIYKNGYLLAGDGSGSTGVGYDTGSGHGGGATCSTEVAGDEVIEIGAADNWIAMNTNSPAVANFDRWASTDPTGDASSRYTYAMVNLTGTYLSAANVTRADRHIVHFKKAGTQDYVVSYDDVALSSAEQVQAWWHYSIEGASGTNTVATNTTSRTATNTLNGNGAELLSAFFPVSGANSVAYISVGPTGGGGNTYRTYTCSSTNGSACTTVTSFEQTAVHYPSASVGATMPTISQPGCTSTGGNCTVADIQDGSYPKVAVFARQAALLTAVSFTSTHSGTAQYLIAGVSPGTYAVSSGGSAVSGSPFTVVSGDNTLYFESTSGAISMAMTPPPSGAVLTGFTTGIVR